MKKIISLFLITLFAFAVLSVSDDADAFFSFDEIKMVGADLSIIEQDVFEPDETPWLYLKLPESPFGGPSGMNGRRPQQDGKQQENGRFAIFHLFGIKNSALSYTSFNE